MPVCTASGIKIVGALSMFRTIILALIFGFTSAAVLAEDARQLTCSGTMIEPPALSQSPETVINGGRDHLGMGGRHHPGITGGFARKRQADI